MARGFVKWFSDKKGFGFIEPHRQAQGAQMPDLFCHFSDIEGSGYRSLAEGDQVEFEAQASSRGPKAVNVRKA